MTCYVKFFDYIYPIRMYFGDLFFEIYEGNVMLSYHK